MKKKILSDMEIVIIVSILVMIVAGCKKEQEPTLQTTPAVYVSEQSVTIAGAVSDDGGAAVSDKGICWGMNPGPTVAGDKISNGPGSGAITCTLDGLTPNTRYYARAYAVNSAGTGYGPQISFHTWNTETVTDIDGNVYRTVTIGSQVWFVDNLRVTHYRNGDVIPAVTDNGEWEGLTSGACCDYDNSAANVPTYGKLYNWFAAEDPRNIAPEGWHVATDAEWVAMASYLGGDATCGGPLKEALLTHWSEPNTGATNQTGFSGLPGGFRNYGGGYEYITLGGGWWSSTSGNPNDGWVYYLDYGSDDLWRYLDDKRYGRSVRCIKD